MTDNHQQYEGKISLKEAIVVEGRYDRIRLSEFIASPVIETGGFRVFSDKEKQELIRQIAARRGILVMTDVDSAGFVIRNFLRGIVPSEKIRHAYIPTVKGKERRKAELSKEGILGVEGLDRDTLIEAIRKSGAQIVGEGIDPSDNEKPNSGLITKLDFFDYGLTGCENAERNREDVLSSLGLPKYMTANAMIAALNCLFAKDEFLDYLTKLHMDKK